MSKRQIVELVAEIAPRPDVPVVVRKLPERRARAMASLPVVPSRGDGLSPELRPDAVGAPEAGARGEELGPDGVAVPESGTRWDETAVSHDTRLETSPTLARDAAGVPVSPASPRPGPPDVIEPLSPGRYKVQFTASAELHDKLERLRALMSSGAPCVDLVSVIEQAVTEKLERLEARRFGQTNAPRQGPPETDTETEPGHEPSPTSRHVPAAVRRAVHERDGDRCCYVDKQGRRCPEHNRLEFHHRHPFGLGGDHSVANVGLLCRAHNAYLAECDYGREALASHRRSKGTRAKRSCRGAASESQAG